MHYSPSTKASWEIVKTYSGRVGILYNAKAIRFAL